MADPDNTIKPRAMTYEAYIASSQWQKLRAQALERDGHTCRLCDSPDALEVHHRRYPPVGSWHLDCVENLTTLCADCHEFVTCRQRAKRYAGIALSADDTLRITPAIEVSHAGLQDIEVQDHGRSAAVNAQWPDRRSVEPALQEHRRNYEQAEED